MLVILPPVDGAGASRTTVVIPVWGRYVGIRFAQALESVASQDLQAPIVVVDNASEVPLPPLGRARVLRTATRLTLGRARNLGLDQVQTPNVVFWDADDLMPPGTLSFMQESLESDSRLVAFGMALAEDPGGKRHRWPRRWVARLVRYPRALAILNSVWSVFPANGPVIMRTDTVRACGGFGSAATGDDCVLGAALLFRGRVGWSERTGCLYLLHEGSNRDENSSVRTLLMNARHVRVRLRSGPGTPAWVRRIVPLIASAQWAAVAGHLAVAALRRLKSRAA